MVGFAFSGIYVLIFPMLFTSLDGFVMNCDAHGV